MGGYWHSIEGVYARPGCLSSARASHSLVSLIRVAKEMRTLCSTLFWTRHPSHGRPLRPTDTPKQNRRSLLMVNQLDRRARKRRTLRIDRRTAHQSLDHVHAQAVSLCEQSKYDVEHAACLAGDLGANVVAAEDDDAAGALGWCCGWWQRRCDGGGCFRFGS